MSEKIRIVCPKCKKRLAVNPGVAGKRVRCPDKACAALIKVPALEEPAEELEDTAPLSRTGRPLWPWLAGGAAAVVLIAAGVTVWLMSGGPSTPVAGGKQPVVPATDGPDKTPEATNPNVDPKTSHAETKNAKIEPSATPPAKLPGAAGERITYLKKAPPLVAVTFRDPDKKDKKDLENWPNAAWPQTFSFGIKKVMVEAVFAEQVTAAVTVRVQTNAGELKLASPDQAGSFTVNGVYVRYFDIEVADGPLPEGPYQAEVSVDGAKTAVMNWSVAKSAAAIKLPGADGERVAYLNKPADLRAVFLSAPDNLPNAGPEAPWDQTIAPGTKKLRIGVVFRQEPRTADVKVRVLTAAGESKLVQPKQDWLLIGATYIRSVFVGSGTDPLPEGPYLAEVLVNGAKVAELNWSVAKSATAAPVADLPKDGAGDPSLTYDMVRKNPAAYRGKRVTWAFQSSSAQGKRILGALDRDAAIRPPHHGLYVVEFADDKEVGRIFRETSFAKGITVTGTVAGEVDQFLVVRDGAALTKEIPQVKVPLLVHPTVNTAKGAEPKTPDATSDSLGHR